MTDTTETDLGFTGSPNSPLLLWLTVGASYHAGDKHDFAAFLKHIHADGDDSEMNVAALYVLGDDGPKEAEYRVTLYAGTAVICIACAAYEVDATKEVHNWC